LVGNPNTGKSLVFNYLTKQYVTVSNYPGTTVDITKGLGRLSGKDFIVIDTPGIDSLFPHSEDEAVTRRLILSEQPRVIVQVIDSKSLRRSLNMTQELAELGIPLILDLNISDEARGRGIKIDTKNLSRLLGANVVQTIATTREGLANLRNSVVTAESSPARTNYGEKIEEAIGYICSLLPESVKYKRFVSIAVLSEDEEILKLIDIDNERIRRIQDKINSLQKEYPQPLRLIIQSYREKRSRQIAEEVVSRQELALSRSWQRILSEITLKPFSAIPAAMVILYIMYKFVGQFAAGTAVDFMEQTVFGEYLNPWFTKLMLLTHPPVWIQEFFIGEYGVITMAITYAIAIIFPIVTAFFLFFGILEDSGYLPRLCVLLDRLFHPMGLNGRAVLPFVLGLGCDTMATLTTRTLYTKKERIIATLLLALVVPCSAQLGVILGILGGISAYATFIWLGIIILSGFSVGFVTSKILPGRRPALIQEIPPIRMPQLSNILLKTWARLKWYLKEAVPLFILGTAVLFVLDKSGILRAIERLASPLVTGILDLPPKATEAFLIGFLRRDYGAAGLYMLTKTRQMDNLQALVSLVVITLFVPCIAQFFVTIKERGAKVAAFILSFTFAFAFVTGGILNFVLRTLKIAF
jgi:ferrous iron transport protein B